MCLVDLGEIIAVRKLEVADCYDATNKLTSRHLPNGILTSYDYDGLHRLTRLLDAKGVATIADHQYQYNTASQITQIAEPTITKTYGYDAVDQLTSATYTNPLQTNENYSYDGVGNRTSSHLSVTYSYQPFNRLTSTSTATLAYDSNGNLTSKVDSSGTTPYAWDFENRLRQVTLPNGATVAYKYDALGRRIQRAPSTVASTNFVYDGHDVLKDLNSDGSTVDYLNGLGIDNKLRLNDSRLIATGPLYFLQDHLGSTTALTNSLGASVSQVTYDGFGNSSGSLLTRYDYTGRERDPDTGLVHYRARSYDAVLGRFVSEDPLGLGAGPNQFVYVRNNPLMLRDPSGKFPLLGAAAVAVLSGEFILHYYLFNRAFDLYPSGDEQGRKKHCYVNCMSTRIHLGGPTMPTVFSIGHEVPTKFYVPNLRSELRDSAGDLAANNFGQVMAFAIWKSCKELCDQCPSF